jgi:SAM-dependent methyltransferase
MSAVLQSVGFACPRCHGVLDAGTEAYGCASCGAAYPVISGIPDFRVAPDPWIGIDEDRDKGLRLEREAAGLGFEATVRAYWAMTPGTPDEDAGRFIAHVLDAERRSGEWLAAIGAPAKAGEYWLDLGCGTADLAAAAGPGVEVVGLDIAFRWLIAAKCRLAERGRAGTMVCGNAEALPFPDARFDRVIALGLLEHCDDPKPVLEEVRRVLRPGGRVHIRTVNRYSLLPEPHVGVWGVGWLPRAWADGYVQWRRGERYLHHRPLSAGELARCLRHAGFAGVCVEAARLLDAEAGRLPGALRFFVTAYRRLSRVAVVAPVARRVAPLLDAEGTAP